MEPSVKNAADPKQVRRAERKDRDRRLEELSDLRVMLGLLEGRRFLWRLLGHCNVFGTPWHSSNLMAHNVGRQDAGRFVMAEINAADQEMFFVMMREAHERMKQDDAATTASHTPSATEEQTDGE